MEINNNDDISPKYDKKPDNLRNIKDVSELPHRILEWINMNSDGVFILADTDGKLIYVTTAIEKIIGYKVSELIGTYWYEKIPLKDVEYVRKQVREYPGDKKNVNINVLNNDGKYILLDCKFEQYVDGTDTYILAYLKDITYKKETEEMMVRSEKMTIAGQLAAGIAHEIRNPLTSLKGFLQLLQAGVSHKEEYFHVMIDEIDKIEAITSELLFISKPLTENRRKESVEQMIEDVIVLLQPQAKLKNIDLVVQQPIHGEIYCDRSQIKQVLINLVKNAIEAMHTVGKITLSVNCNHESVDVSIADEGNGIPDDILHKLGEPFFTTKQSGTGLGLLISKQILDSHNATLKIKQNKIKGSTFQLVFSK
ncbi:ATP-binding protein [Oceanobacillus longus]|uniref:histidine kinase n=1 Tax=Oceanobacillus longus TaxID=930120 RepID=A0ABV8GW69_9BACI